MQAPQRLLWHNQVTRQRSLQKYGVLKLTNSDFTVNCCFTGKYHFDHQLRKLTFQLKNENHIIWKNYEYVNSCRFFFGGFTRGFCNWLQSNWGSSSFITCFIAFFITYMQESHTNLFPYEQWHQNNDKSQDLNCSLWTMGLCSILSFCCLSFSIWYKTIL